MPPVRSARQSLKKHRKSLKLSLRKAADQIGVSHVAWLKWEKGEQVPLPACRRALARWSGGVVAEDSWPKSKLDARMSEVA